MFILTIIFLVVVVLYFFFTSKFEIAKRIGNTIICLWETVSCLIENILNYLDKNITNFWKNLAYHFKFIVRSLAGIVLIFLPPTILIYILTTITPASGQTREAGLGEMTLIMVFICILLIIGVLIMFGGQQICSYALKKKAERE